MARIRRLVLAGGGNTSVKLGDHMLVKSSGSVLATIQPEDFVDLDRAAVQALLDSDLGSSRDEREAAFKQAVLAARREPERGQRPSVESVLHHLMPGRFVVHLHATLVNEFSCCQEGRRLVCQQLRQDVIWLTSSTLDLLWQRRCKRGSEPLRAQPAKSGFAP